MPSETIPAPIAVDSLPVERKRDPVYRHFAKAVGSAAVVDRGAKSEWMKDCDIHRACPGLDKPQSCKENGLAPIDVTRFGAVAPASEGEKVAIRGPLGLTTETHTLRGCGGPRGVAGRACCNHSGGSAILGEGDADAVVELQSLGCLGDESRSCCNVPAFGQVVTAVGTLIRNSEPRDGTWALKDAALCAE